MHCFTHTQSVMQTAMRASCDAMETKPPNAASTMMGTCAQTPVPPLSSPTLPLTACALDSSFVQPARVYKCDVTHVQLVVCIPLEFMISD